MALTDGKTWDNNGSHSKDYYATGNSAAVSNRQIIVDVTPNCAIINKE